MDPVLLALLMERLVWTAGAGAVTVGFLQRNEWAYPLLRQAAGWVGARMPGRETQRKLDLVVSQVYPNGGSSLFDLSKRNEAALGQIRRHLAIVEAQSNVMRDDAGLLTYSTSAEGAHVQSSRPLLNLLGIEPEEAVGLGWKSCIAPADLPHYAENWASAVEDQRDFYCDVRLRNKKTGETIPTRVAADVVRVEQAVVGWLGRVEVVRP